MHPRTMEDFTILVEDFSRTTVCPRDLTERNRDHQSCLFKGLSSDFQLREFI